MKYFILILFVSISTISFAQKEKINWMSFDEALAAQKENPKKILMDAYTIWCGPCKMLDKNTFQNEDVAKYVNEHYYAVKFNAEGNETINFKGNTFANPEYKSNVKGRNSVHEFSRALNVTAYPTIVFFNEEGSPIMPVKGYQTANQLEIYLKLFLEDGHEKISTKEDWEAYQSNFAFEFKG